LEETNSQTDKVNIYVQKENLSGEAQNDENLENFLKVENVKCSRKMKRLNIGLQQKLRTFEGY